MRYLQIPNNHHQPDGNDEIDTHRKNNTEHIRTENIMSDTPKDQSPESPGSRIRNTQARKKTEESHVSVTTLT